MLVGCAEEHFTFPQPVNQITEQGRIPVVNPFFKKKLLLLHCISWSGFNKRVGKKFQVGLPSHYLKWMLSDFYQDLVEGVGGRPKSPYCTWSWFCPRMFFRWVASKFFFPPNISFYSLKQVSDFILAVGSNRAPIRWTTELMKSVSLPLVASSSSPALFILVLRGTLGLDSVSVAASLPSLN